MPPSPGSPQPSSRLIPIMGPTTSLATSPLIATPPILQPSSPVSYHSALEYPFEDDQSSNEGLGSESDSED
jgi:hypothetical protein